MLPTLTFKARMDHPRAGGCSGPLRTTINGKGIGPKNIANRPAQMTALSGIMLSAWYDAGVRLWFGPDYESIEKSVYKPLDVVSYDYMLRLDGMFEQGRNVIKFENVDKRADMVVIMDDVAFSWSPPSRFRPPKELKPAPPGEIPTIEPLASNKIAYQAAITSDGRIKVTWQDRELVFTSTFNSPPGPWSKQKPKRELVKLDECILVRDTPVNPSSTEDRPVAISHSTAPGPYQDLWLSGRPMPTKAGASGMPSNPSVVVLGKNSGFAMMPRDDIFRIHYRGRCDKTIAELTDKSLVLRPGVSYQQEWLIFPLDKPDYWQFVNAARRHFDTNFAIPGSFFFVYSRDPAAAAPWTIVNQIEWGKGEYVALGPHDYWKGMFPHGPFMRTLDQSRIILMHKMIEAISPDTKRLQYFNCFNRSTAKQKEDPDGWSSSQVRLADGTQATSGPTLTFYVPTLDNEWGREMDQLVDWMINTLGADGLYWDCYDYWSYNHYGDPWDGWTADIDAKTFKINCKRSCLTLISWPWREKLTSWLLSKGRPLVANGNPSLTSEYKYRFPRFVETADISNLSKAHLYTPIALGDHVTERNEVDAYRWMLNALDWGGLYYWYSQTPTRPAFTSVMFPFTPIELHRGYLIGEERILTKESGLFGWGDASEFQVHVFDRLGRFTDEIKPPRVMKDGRAYAEVRIPEGYAAAIVRVKR
ncbi:MAG: hypothetical protein ABIP48_16405 [Planctomycetota bacterium]